MNVTQQPFLVIGYTLHSPEILEREFLGSAQIDGLLVEHLLTICTRPSEAIDLGRNADGDLVWVSKLPHSFPSTESQETGYFSSELTFHDSEASCPNRQHQENIEERKKLLPAVFDALHRHRKKVLFAMGAGSVFFLSSYLLPQPDPAASTSLDDKPSVAATLQPRELAQSPESAAIEFVMKTEISGVNVPRDVNADDLTATIVSQSGEIVLVDVQATTEEGLTTFATLLLQKAEFAWRIREVFEPR